MIETTQAIHDKKTAIDQIFEKFENAPDDHHCSINFPLVEGRPLFFQK